MKKYKLTDETKVVNGHTLHRIQALKDFSNVKAGDIGGCVEKEENLSHDGNCWVYDNACVSGYARILNNAIITDNACVSGSATISNEARVLGRANIFGNTRVSGYARISEDANISKTPLQIYGTKHFVNVNGDKLQIGCQLHSIESWKAHFEKIGKAEGYSDEEIDEYKSYIDLAEKLMNKESNAVLCQKNMAGKIKILEDNNVVNWEQRGYEVAKDILINQLKEITTNDLGEANNKLIYDSIDLAKNFINTLRFKPFD